VIVSPQAASLAALAPGAVVGTSSLRRQAQVAAKYPRLAFRMLRGNVETRLAKLDRGEYAAIILAAAGLKRLGLENRITSYLALDDSLPAPGQAALGIECLAARKDVRALAAALEDRGASLCVRAERAVSLALGGNCALPLAAHARLAGERIELRALVASPDGAKIASAQCEGAAADPEALGTRAAELLRERGAAEILSALVG
jgi:hydroxymethylbilane synthase